MDFFLLHLIRNDFDIIYSRFNSEKIEGSFHQDASLARTNFLTMNICFNYKKTIYILEYSTNKQALTKNKFSLSAKIYRIYI